MIITRTPYRISFVGGGTDIREYYKKDEGKVLSASIDKYIYVVLKKQIGIVEAKYRVNYSQIEFCNHINEIQHPIVREALKIFKINFPVEITTFSDVPAQTGLGSSSSFAVGLVNGLFALTGKNATKHEVATLAAKIEINILERNMGKQDHFAASYGNLNIITFRSDETVIVEPVFHDQKTREHIQKNLLLLYTYLKRDASEVLMTQKKVTEQKRNTLFEMKDLVFPLREIISSGKNLDKIGKILDKAWFLKKSITNEISSKNIDKCYSDAKKYGSLGGKLLGAGGGGFFLFYIKKYKQKNFIKAFPKMYNMNFKFEHGGTRITYYDQTTI